LATGNNAFLSHQISTSHQPPVLFSHNKSAPATLGFVIGFLFAEVVLDL